jgi:uncharacterized protein
MLHCSFIAESMDTTPPNPEFTPSIEQVPVAPQAPAKPRAVAPVWHTVIFVVGTLALTGLQAHQQPTLHSMNLPSRVPLYVLMIGFELFLFTYVWIGLRVSGTKVRDIVGGKWSKAADFWLDVGIALGFWCAVAGMLILMNFLLGKNETQIDAVKALVPRSAVEMVVWVLLAVTAGFCEEFIFRGYLQRQFLALTGRAELAVLFQAIIFGLAHLYQGWKGAVAITVYGALFGMLAAWRKSLRPGMMQHAMQDTFSGLVASYALRHHMF